jgi:hypothetical protein
MEPNQNEPSASPKQQVAERVRQAANVLVTVRSNPSVDELAATIGLTLMLNKLGKHATAVFSGAVPSTLEFLKPEETLESNTDSLRDFIISLDKSKADKLRYKVEENVVRIFITPYRTSITEKDLEFTQGDFNVDIVLALGVTQREELDQAIVSHGRILHDATVVTIIAGQRESTLGNINWQEPGASSLSEMLVSISEAFQGGLIDSQMATAFLTGIVAETERFSNPKTTPKVMTMAAQLMAAGANQQLIANELQKNGTSPLPSLSNDGQSPKSGVDGSLSIAHNDDDNEGDDDSKPVPDSSDNKALSSQENTHQNEPFLPPPPQNESYNPLMPQAPMPTISEPPAPEQTSLPEEILPPLPSPQDNALEGQIHIDNEGNLMRTAQQPKHKIVEPLQPGQAESLQPLDLSNSVSSATPISKPDDTTLPLTADPLITASQTPIMPPAPDPQVPQLPDDHTSLLDIEKTVNSPHLGAPSTTEPNTNLDSARNAVLDAINQVPYDPARPEPRADLGAQTGPQILQNPGQPTPLEDLRLPMPPLPEENNQDNTMPPPPVPPPMMPQ